MPKTSGPPRRPSDLSASRLGLLVESLGPWTQTGVARDRWSTPGAFGPSASPLGQLFDTAAPSTVQSRPGCWLKPWAFGSRPEWPETAGRHRVPSDPTLSHPGKLVNTVGPRARARVTPESYSTLWDIRPENVIPGRAVRNCGPSGMGPKHPREIFNPVGHRTRGRHAREGWSNPWALGRRPEWPGTSLDPACPCTNARVTRVSWSTPQALGPGLRRPVQLVDPVDLQTRDPVARESWSTPLAP